MNRHRGGWAVAAANAAGMAAGYLLDRALGDPRRLHPVAGYGRLVGAAERRLYAPTTAAGTRFTTAMLATPVLAAVAASRATRRRPMARFLLMTGATWAALGGTSLRRQATRLADELDAGDLAAARDRLPNLCGRDPSKLDQSELVRATIESVAENTSDAEVGPLVWAALAGLPGIVGYRAANTLDAMVGHRNERYVSFGTASARADDVANLAPSRLTGALVVVTAHRVGLSPARALGIWLRDGNQHPSPNSGQCEAAFAGALGVRLGGTNVYFGHSEARPRLGDGRAPSPADIRGAVRLSAAVGAAALAATATHALAAPARRAVIRRLARRHGRAPLAASSRRTARGASREST
jgi:adenosylcobinamide-phosphate synthase